MKDLTLFAALDAIVQLANAPSAWTGTEVELIDAILAITGAELPPGRREWLIEQLDTTEAQDILYRRGVMFLFGTHDSRVSVGPGVSLGSEGK
ncbi:hypothetical protein [Pseudogulbenkiania ferrooxidans]|uniref:Uncharacterized protein n=1 Tax=Pseudogulbenkiania ferrooxidans 2002 TaxID=279714 RepID=B9Z6U9_9NEIS|nr:hypothetical protein [Pseudogulbenkiania ferrooxidans]EEG07264.1 hypothetical protein FuraDRAFT_3085 [Pseudogulbenkiania ferrooxidans 2002]